MGRWLTKSGGAKELHNVQPVHAQKAKKPKKGDKVEESAKRLASEALCTERTVKEEAKAQPKAKKMKPSWTDNVLVVGACGQLGRTLMLLSQSLPSYRKWVYADIHEAQVPGVIHLDATREDDVRKAVKDNHISYVVNCAAFTDVDKESLPDCQHTAMMLNIDIPRVLAKVCKEEGVKLIHISTDYVFDGRRPFRKYKRTSATNPVNAYGMHKLMGEHEIEKAFGCLPNWMTIRTSWLFSPFRTNFVKKVREWALKAKDKSGYIKVATDEVSSPTSTWCLANFIKDVICSDGKQWKPGIWNFTGGQAMSRYEFAKEILKAFGLDKDVKVKKAKAGDFLPIARRPKRSVLDMQETEEAFKGIHFMTSKDEWKRVLNADAMAIKFWTWGKDICNTH